MELFRPHQPQSQLLAPPPPRRLSTPAGERLSTILESSGASINAPQYNPRDSVKSWSSKIPVYTLPRASADTTPPSYHKEWQPSSVDLDGSSGWRSRFRSKRGGWGRCLILLLVLFLIVIGLAVGLGVGLGTRHKSSNQDDNTSGNAQSSQPGSSNQFPLGTYTFVTSLREIQSNCTSNPATWRCYPYSTYESDSSTAGLAVFNWVLSASESHFASNSSPPTTSIAGIPANVTLSSSMNPFTISLSNQSLTYINNNDQPRYSFTFTYAQNVVPTASLDSSDSASTCVYNSTVFTVTFYLTSSPAKTYPGASLQNSTLVNGGYPQWPYAVEIFEYVDGGQNVPMCYQTTNGNLGQQIGSLTPQPADQQCLCKYTNFDT